MAVVSVSSPASSSLSATTTTTTATTTTPVTTTTTTTTATTSTTKTTRTKQQQSLYKSIAAVAGSVLEWYDFAIFGSFSDVIGKVFFPPHQSKHAQITEAFVVFGSAFLMRPLGGVLLGHIGDVHGRKKALEVSIFLMAVPTFVMGCLPSYALVGPWAMVGLALTRLMQGLSVGGQLMSALVYCCEIRPRKHWGFHGSLAFVGASSGILSGSLVAAILRHAMSASSLESWGWRIPFWGGWVVGLAGLYLRSQDDADGLHAPGGEIKKIPLQLAFARRNLRSLAAATLVPMCSCSGFYLCFVWMPIFMSAILDPPVPHAFVVNSIALFFCMIIVKPYSGVLSDQFGRVRTMTVGGFLMIFLSVPVLYVISWGNTWSALVAQVVIGVSFALWNGPMGAWLVETFEPEARMTSVAIGFNTSQALLGGFSPAIATFLVDQWGNYAPGIYLAVIFMISLVGLRCVAPSPPTLSADLPSTTTSATRDELMPLQKGDNVFQTSV